MKNNYFFKRTLAAVLTLMLSSLMWASDFEVDGIYYNFNEDGESVEVAQPLIKYSGDIVIPSSIAYEGKTYNVTSIGSLAFNSCSSLTSIEIPNSVTSIGYNAFSRCISLTSVVLPNSVTSIGDEAFKECSSLTSVVLPNSVTSIEDDVFAHCSSLTSVEIPNSVTSIGEGAFAHCSSLTSVEIPNSVISIGDYAFYGCSSLTSVEIPNSVTSIGERAFDVCFSLTSLTVADDNPIYDSREDCNAIIKTASNELIAGCQNTVIPNSVASIGNYAFNSCYYLTSVVLPNSVTSIGSYAFYNCSSLTSIEIPNSVTSIGDGTFRSCSSLTSVEIPNSVTSIGNEAFYNCSSLTSVICYAEEVPELDRGGVFRYVPTSEATLHVPASALEAYKAADEWKDFGTILPIDGNVNGISSTTAEQETDATYYTLDGVSVKNPTKKGIYIKNGKKVFIR